MNDVTREILQKVKAVLAEHPEGEKFFDKLDGEIIRDASPKIIRALFDLVPENYFLVLSGEFGKKVADGINRGDFPDIPYHLFNGGIRKGNKPDLIRSSNNWPIDFHRGIFLDDSIYGGATYYALVDYFKDKYQTLERAAIIYDGCPIKKPYIASLFRYYDHFDSTPNYKF